MLVKDIIVEDFVNYKYPSMFIISVECDFKCCKEAGCDYSLCQNSSIVSMPTKEFSEEEIYNMFKNNDITKAVVIGGLEPFLQTDEVVSLISYFRSKGEDCDFVIYTGYNIEEIPVTIRVLSKYKNVVIKFGRYVPTLPSQYDDVLGVTLASNNQYGMRLS